MRFSHLPLALAGFPARVALFIGLLVSTSAAWAALPAGWINFDIGSPALAGSASFDNNTWTIAGGGEDIWGAADQFQFVCQSYDGDCTVIARVTGVPNTDTWAKGGIMVRQDATAGSVFADVVATPANGVSFQWRNSAAGSCDYSQITGVTAPVWVKLVRITNSFSGYYSTDGNTWIQIGTSQPVAMTSSVLVGLAVTSHNPGAIGTATFTDMTVANTPPPPNPSTLSSVGLYRELWTGLNFSSGNSLYQLTNTTANPNWPDKPDPAYTKVFTKFETETDSGLPNYGQRLRTFLVPPTNGNYTFWIASDDASTLFLSTDENPANITRVAYVDGWTPSEAWTVYSSQQSAPVTLQGGRRYYMEAIMQQGSGGDNLAVRWQLPDGTFEQPMLAQSAAGTLMLPCTGVVTAPGIYVPPAAVSVNESQDAVFSLLVTNQAPVTYQWQMNGVALTDPSSQQSVLRLSSVNMGYDGKMFACVVSNSSGTVTSTPARLTVKTDSTPPKVVRVSNSGTNSLVIVYSKSVEPASATNVANYVFTNGLSVIGAVLNSDFVSVTLTTAPMTFGGNYTLVINNVRDRASVPNVIATNTTVRFVASLYTSQDIGPSSPSGVVTAVPGGFDVSGGGADIGGASDQFQYAFELRQGDFDIQVRMNAFSQSDAFAKAGLMVRESLDANSRFAAVFASPSIAGAFFECRNATGGNAVSLAKVPVNYPSMWLRMQRVGSQFTGYASYDGLTWQRLGSVSLAMNDPVYFGMVVCSHNSGTPAVAQFRDLSAVTNALTGTIALPGEPMGPCSRTTGLVISEIMFHPSARADGRDLEFVEIFNTQPVFEDISGYSLSGDIAYTFPPGTILPSGAYLVVASVPADVQAAYGISNVTGPYTNKLSNSAGTVRLRNTIGAVLLEVKYDSVPPWPVAADGTGHSIVLSRASYGEGNPKAWSLSDVKGGSPGGPDGYGADPARGVVINEILAHTDLPQLDALELFNTGTGAIDLSGCYLTDDAKTNRFRIPDKTVIPGRGFVYFDETQLGFRLNAAGESIFLLNAADTRVLDAVRFEGQANGVSWGRYPDGAPTLRALAGITLGTTNSQFQTPSVVINEIMYDPISGSSSDQYVELYNRGADVVDLSNWKFASGINFSFPANTRISPGSYMVVARDAARMLTNYSNLNATNLLGNFSGSLSGKGERLALSMPDEITSTNAQGVVTTNTIYIVVNEVTYGNGGRWGQWSHGGGSSLELIDPNADNSLAPNWADSDESNKSSWTYLSYTGVLDLGSGSYMPDQFQVFLEGEGECLFDNVEVFPSGGANRVTNPNFSNGATGWYFQGTQSGSTVQATNGFGGGSCLHIRATGRGDTGANRIRTVLSSTLTPGSTATMRARVRWLKGNPEILMRLHGNWLELAGRMDLPVNLGTPGARNSRFVANAGPAIVAVAHSPVLPSANQAVLVTARVSDPNAVASVNLNYRNDTTSGAVQSVRMYDDGTGGDLVANDGIYSAKIPGQAATTIIAFSIQASDNASTPVTNSFPNNAPARECLVGFGESAMGGTFGTYRTWLTKSNINKWASRENNSNDPLDATFAYGNFRVVYNMETLYSGSPFHTSAYNSPVGNYCDYVLHFPSDDLMLGAGDFVIATVGNLNNDDTMQREQAAFTFLRQMGVPSLYRRYVFMFVNGLSRGPILEDAQQPNSDTLSEYFPDDSNGNLYKIEDWFEFDDAGSGFDYVTATLDNFVTTGGAKKAARYRWNWRPRAVQSSATDFTNLFSLVDVLHSAQPEPYTSQVESMVDVEEWMRTFAIERLVGNWDSFSYNRGKNMYTYKPQNGRWNMLAWDIDFVLGLGDGPTGSLYGGQDTSVEVMRANPKFARAYLRAFQDAVNGPLQIAKIGPNLDAKYAALVANGLSVNQPSGIKDFINQRRSYVQSQLTAAAAPFTVSSTISINNGVASISGTAPFDAATISVNGGEYPITWTSVTSWTVKVPLTPGANHLGVVGVDRTGQSISSYSNNVAAVYNVTLPSPVGQVVINEIMYNPLVPNSQFVELFNNSSTTTFDLSGWTFHGLSYTFPAGATIGPNSYLVLAANRAAFASAYGATVPVFDTFTGSLQLDGETLSLNQPGTNGDVIVARVRYEGGAPWPLEANASGCSLQLIDSLQDNWREGNWSVYPSSGFMASPGAANPVKASLPAFQPLWINELQAENNSFITNKAGQYTPWLELYNPTTNTVSLAGLYLANDYSKLTNWAFPDAASIKPGEFKVIFADGLVNLSSLTELHTEFVLSKGSGSLVLSRLYNGKPQILDYVNYTNLAPNQAYGSQPDAQSFSRQPFVFATPGASNLGAAATPSYVAYDQVSMVYRQNFDALPNPGTKSVNTANPVTINGVTYSLANPYDFAAPAFSIGSVGGLGIPEMAGWYGLASFDANVGTRFGATSGDQTTGGQISFGLPNSGNRALGLLATSSTGPTAFGVKLINQTHTTFKAITVAVTGELWRQSNIPKTLRCHYYIDPSAASPLSTNYTGAITGLNVAFPTASDAIGGVAVDGTAPGNQTNLVVMLESITNWSPGAALWLVWDMSDASGKAQGLAIDNLQFSASDGNPCNCLPTLAAKWVPGAGRGEILLNLGTYVAEAYQLEYTTNLNNPQWNAVGAPVVGDGSTITVTNTVEGFDQYYLRLRYAK